MRFTRVKPFNFIRVRRRQLVRFGRMGAFLAIVGPGIIAANADNDASGIFGYSYAGAAYQYKLLWILLLSTIALGVAQEMCARMGAVTGKGLADLIREHFGVSWTLVAMVALLIANFATTVSEFAGILAAFELCSPATWWRFVTLPAVGILVWVLVARGTYRRLERVLLGLSVIYLFYIVSAFLSHPAWSQVLKESVWPNLVGVGHRDYVFQIIQVIGTTITPWGQFYIQSSVRDKGISVKDYHHTRIDVYFGAFFTNFIAFFIIVCCGATLYVAGIHQVNDAGQVARALTPLAGKMATVLFGLGLFNASFFGAVTVPLATSYAFTEALGWESSVGRTTAEAPLFIHMFTWMLAAAVAVVAIFPTHLAMLIILPNIVGAVLLPIILVMMLKLVNDPRIMGDMTNSRGFNIVAWLTTAVLIVLSLILLVTNFFPNI